MKLANKLVDEAAGMSPAAFAGALNANAVRALADWRNLHGKLLSDSDCGHHIKYDESYQPTNDPVTKY